MVVRTRSKGCAISGIEVGAQNVQRYFSKDAAVIELELDHLQIQCKLNPAFWLNRPEIQDPRLSAWLESKNLRSRPSPDSIPIAMIPNGNNSFRLQPVRRKLTEDHRKASRPFNAA